MDKEQSLLQLDDAYRPTFERIMGELGVEDNKQAYLLIASYGFLMKTAPTDFRKGYSVTRTSYLDDEERALVLAMALEDPQAEPPTMAEAYQLVERYANGGIALIAELLDSPKGFRRAFREAVDVQRAQSQAEMQRAAESTGIGVPMPE